MSTNTPPSDSRRKYSLKREPGQQSRRAICFETPRNGGERVRLAQDVEPRYPDSITVSVPDGREYADAPPTLPLPGEGEEYDSCGEDIPMRLCESCGSPTWVGNTCRRSSCPRCWRSWAFHRAVEATTAVDGTRRKRWSETSGDMFNHHIVVSPPEGTRFDSSDPVDRLFEVGKNVLGRINADTGFLVYHPYRIKEEYRGEIRGHDSGEGDMQWKDVLNLPPGERAEYLVHSPHLHAFVVSENVLTEFGAPAIYDETGVVIHRVTKRSEPNVSLYDMEDLAAATAYSLSHAGITYDGENDVHRVAARFFGETATIERRENVRAEADAAMREVAGDVLGVSFRRRDCQKSVPGSSEGDENVVRARTNDEGGSGGRSPPPGVRTLSTPRRGREDEREADEWTAGNTGGFATDSDVPDARGVNSVPSEVGGMADSDHDHDHGEGETCGGNLVPIWDAPEYLNDDEWRESIADETAEELHSAYDEWVSLGEPKPEDLSPDAPDPPPD